jgi:KaiC/GvpD/RAD55 family RecA-like ATPase
MSITGDSGHGKTELVVKFIKQLCLKNNTKADYFSFEQGHSKSLQDAIQRNNMEEVKGKVMFITGGTFDEVLANLEKRDHIDSTRADSPLMKAEDSIILDNSNLSREEQLEWVLGLVNEKIAASN